MGAAPEEEEEGVKWLKHYSSTQRILIIGDGDFSFSRALAVAFCSGENLVATSLDSYEALMRKYSKAESNIMVLKIMGTTVLHGVDAKFMKHHTDLKMKRFDRIVFNFPHDGFKGKEDDLHMIRLHKGVIREFFRNAIHLLRPFGEIHVSHKAGQPYENWGIEQLASEFSLAMVEKVVFHKEDYPGYNQKRGDGAKCDEPFNLGACCTFKFCMGDVKKLKKVSGNRIGSIPSLVVGGSVVHPEILATNMRPLQPHTLVSAWPWSRFPPPVNAVHMPLTLNPDSFRVTQRHQPGNFDGILRAAFCFLQQGITQPIISNPAPLPNALSSVGGIVPPTSRIIINNSLLAPSPTNRITSAGLLAPPPASGITSTDLLAPPLTSRITSTSLIAPQEQPTPILGPWGSAGYSYSAQEYHMSLQREYEMQRQVMPGGSSLEYSAFLEHRLRDPLEKEKWLQSMIALYGSR